MPRPPGRTNADHAQKRHALAASVARHLAFDPSPEDSLRGLARAAEVSVPTLRHYFGDREGVLRAAYAVLNTQGAPFLQGTADPGDVALEPALRGFLFMLDQGLDRGVGQVHAEGLRRGLGSSLGPAYLEALFEPTLHALEARLGVHQARGELREGDLRVAALQLLGPVLLTRLHQDHLGGCDTRPLDRDGFAKHHLDAFLRAWATDRG